MQTHLEQNNMHNEIQTWTLASVLMGLFNAIYNAFTGFSLNDWIAIGGFMGMVFSLLMQRYYARRRDRREAEKHEWERRQFERENKP